MDEMLNALFFQFTKSLFRIAGHDQDSQIFQIFPGCRGCGQVFVIRTAENNDVGFVFRCGFQSCLHLVKAWMVNDLESCTGEKAACKGCPCFSPDRIAKGEEKDDRSFGMIFGFNPEFLKSSGATVYSKRFDDMACLLSGFRECPFIVKIFRQALSLVRILIGAKEDLFPGGITEIPLRCRIPHLFAV